MFTPEGDLIVSASIKLPFGKEPTGQKVYRLEMLSSAGIRAVSQQSGTNVIDIDFEIIDPDDANATVGILAAVNGNFDNPASLIVPTAWVDGTGSKIGSPIATNQLHRVSWNVKVIGASKLVHLILKSFVRTNDDPLKVL